MLLMLTVRVGDVIQISEWWGIVRGRGRGERVVGSLKLRLGFIFGVTIVFAMEP